MWKTFAVVILSVAAAAPRGSARGRPGPADADRAAEAYSRSAAAIREPAGASVPSASVPREVRRAVVADAARRFKVAESAVVLGQAEQVTWSDGSLGCPQRGQMYTQNLVAGYRIVAITSEGQMVYHTDSQGFAVTCGGNKDSAPQVQPPARSAPDR